MRAFRALPAVPFEDASPAGAPEAARLRHAVVNGTDWFYAVNTGPDPCRLQLPPGLCDAVTGDPMPCEINLDGYELRAMSRR